MLAAVTAGSYAAAAVPPNVAVTPGMADAQGGSLAIDPTDPSRLAVAYSTGRSEAAGRCFVARSADGGRTWESETLAGDTAHPLPAGATHCADPAVAFGSEGTIYVAYDASRLGGPGRAYLASSTDHGVTFGAPTPLDPDPGGGGDFEPAVAAGPSRGTVSVAFERYGTEFVDASVLAVTSNDGGRSFSQPVLVSPAEQNAVNGRATAATDRAGTLYVGWVDAAEVDFDGSGDARLEVAASPDGGRSFAAPVTVATVPSGCGPNDDCGNRYPSASLAAGSDGVVDLAWSAGAYPDPARVFVARSLDSGTSWTVPTPLAVPSGAQDHDEFQPSVAIAPNGRVDLGWADQARDSDAGLLDVQLSHSLDGGRSFSAPFRLDAAPSNSRALPFAAAVEVAASDGAAQAAWRGSDIVFARVQDATPPRIPRVAGPRSVRGPRPSYRLFSSDDFTPTAALRFRCAFDGAALHACRARYVQALRPGRHVFRVRAIDGAGNRSPLRSLTVLVR